MTTNPTPKARFLESGDNISSHRKLTEQREFQRALDFALLEYQGIVTRGIQDQGSAMAAGLKIQGALEFITQLRLLSEAPMVSEPKIVQSLNHRA